MNKPVGWARFFVPTRNGSNERGWFRPDRRHALHKAIGQIMPLRRRLQQEVLELPAMRGIEGAAAAAYFRAYTELFPASLEFSGRPRRPPPDVTSFLPLGRPGSRTVQ
jgi:CRISPR-associated protein Cas1